MSKAERTKLDEANVTIVDLQGTKAKLADKVNKLQVESENKFAGIAMTGKRVVFLVDMSGSMERTEENVMAPDKWPTVRDTVCKVMRTLPDLEKFQVILFSGKVRYLLEAGDWIPYEKEKSIDRVYKAMSAVKPAEDTNLYAGLEEAFKYRGQGAGHRLLLLGRPADVRARADRDPGADADERDGPVGDPVAAHPADAGDELEPGRAGPAEGADQLGRLLLRVAGRRARSCGPCPARTTAASSA